jgi:hypothetical protein
MEKKTFLLSTTASADSTNANPPQYLDPSVTIGGIALSGTLIGSWVWKYFLQPRIDRIMHGFQRTLETDMKILGRLYVLLEKYNAARVIFYQVHNGSSYISGQHQWKVSITHEVLANGISSVKHWSQGEPALDFLKNYPNILEDQVLVLSLSDHSMDGILEFRHRFLNHGIQKIIALVVKGYDKNEIIGFLSIHWNNKDLSLTNSTEDLEMINLEVEKIVGLLLRKNENVVLESVAKLWKKY